MTLHIREGETQRSLVERVLVEEGRISAHDATYDLRDHLGRQRGITRLAPVIDDLRSRGWDIGTLPREQGEQAVYVLRSAPASRSFSDPIGRVRECPSCHTAHAVGTSCARQPIAV